jgi:hypothetical protein
MGKHVSQKNHVVIKPYFEVIFTEKEITFDMNQKEVENKLGETSRFEVVKLEHVDTRQTIKAISSICGTKSITPKMLLLQIF